MIWLDAHERYTMFTVRKTDRGYELMRLGPHGATTVETFDSVDAALQRWSELEESLRYGIPALL
jgi:hypothetical protein